MTVKVDSGASSTATQSSASARGNSSNNGSNDLFSSLFASALEENELINGQVEVTDDAKKLLNADLITSDVLTNSLQTDLNLAKLKLGKDDSHVKHDQHSLNALKKSIKPSGLDQLDAQSLSKESPTGLGSLTNTDSVIASEFDRLTATNTKNSKKELVLDSSNSAEVDKQAIIPALSQTINAASDLPVTDENISLKIQSGVSRLNEQKLQEVPGDNSFSRNLKAAQSATESEQTAEFKERAPTMVSKAVGRSGNENAMLNLNITDRLQQSINIKEKINSANSIDSSSQAVESLTLTNNTSSINPTPILPAHLKESVSVYGPRFQEHVKETVQWMSDQKISQAEIKIQPESLGPVTIHLRIEQGEATISFSAPHADTRTALEASVSTLRDMLSSNGITLGQTNIGSQPQQMFNQSANNSGNFSGESNRQQQDNQSNSNKLVADTSMTPEARSIGRRLVDLFA